jgi:cytochrome b involved in lipid metabolism
MESPSTNSTPTEVKLVEYKMEDIAQHKTQKDCWTVIYGRVYNVTKFLDDHPGSPFRLFDSTRFSHTFLFLVCYF